MDFAANDLAGALAIRNSPLADAVLSHARASLTVMLILLRFDTFGEHRLGPGYEDWGVSLAQDLRTVLKTVVEFFDVAHVDAEHAVRNALKQTPVAPLLFQVPLLNAARCLSSLSATLRSHGRDALVQRLVQRIDDVDRIRDAHLALQIREERGLAVGVDNASMRGAARNAKVLVSVVKSIPKTLWSDVTPPDMSWFAKLNRSVEEVWRRRLRGAISMSCETNLHVVSAAHRHQALVLYVSSSSASAPERSEAGAASSISKLYKDLQTSAATAGVTRRPTTHRTVMAHRMGVVPHEADAVVLFGYVHGLVTPHALDDAGLVDSFAKQMGAALAWKLWDVDEVTSEQEEWFQCGV